MEHQLCLLGSTLQWEAEAASGGCLFWRQQQHGLGGACFPARLAFHSCHVQATCHSGQTECKSRQTSSGSSLPRIPYKHIMSSEDGLIPTTAAAIENACYALLCHSCSHYGCLPQSALPQLQPLSMPALPLPDERCTASCSTAS